MDNLVLGFLTLDINYKHFMNFQLQNSLHNDAQLCYDISYHCHGRKWEKGPGFRTPRNF
jgi:hypothetical protein